MNRLQLTLLEFTSTADALITRPLNSREPRETEPLTTPRISFDPWIVEIFLEDLLLVVKCPG